MFHQNDHIQKQLQQSNTVYSVKFAQIYAFVKPNNPSSQDAAIYSHLQDRNTGFVGQNVHILDRENGLKEALQWLYTVHQVVETPKT